MRIIYVVFNILASLYCRPPYNERIFMLLKALPLDNETPVQYVCFHPIAAAHLQNGQTVNYITGEKYEPSCMAVDYEYESVLQELCSALGWQGGTIHQAIAEVKRLKAAEKGESPKH